MFTARRLGRAGLERGLRLFVRVAPDRLLARVSYNPLFDNGFYLTRYRDVALAHVDAWRHYRLHGAREQRKPNPIFDAAWYLQTYPDVAASRLLPLDHYFLYGARERRNPGPDFSTRYYLDSNPDVLRAGVNPLLHYLRSGMREGRRPMSGSANRVALVYNEVARPTRLAAAVDALRRRALAVSIRRLPPGQQVALVISDGYPRPTMDAGSVFLLNVVRLLREHGFEIVLVPTNSRAADKSDRARLRDLGVRALPAIGSTSIPGLLNTLGDRLDLAWLSRHDCGGVFIDEVRTRCPRAKVVFDPVDLHWLRQSREAAVANDRVKMYEAMSVREHETYLSRMADLSVVVSTAEQGLLRRTVPGVNVLWLPIPHNVPGRRTGFDTRSGVAFVGNYLHRPNVDAVVNFLDDAWPIVRSRLPLLDFYVVGPDLPKTLTARRDVGVHFVGHVDDLDAWLNRVRLTVAPLRFGAGAKGKVIASLANGVPCVASSIAAEGLSLTHDAIALADDPQSQADEIVRLHEDRDAWRKMSDAALAWAHSTTSMDAARVQFGQIIQTLGLTPTHELRRAA